MHAIIDHRLLSINALFNNSLFLANVTGVWLRFTAKRVKFILSQCRSQVILIFIKSMLSPPEHTIDIYENLHASVVVQRARKSIPP